jgi:serine/threonine protein kinase
VQVACALEYLHRHPLYLSNRDVKGDNVLITTFEKHADDVFRPQVKVADFGFVGVRNRTSRLGTPDYVAPEIYQLKYVS